MATHYPVPNGNPVSNGLYWVMVKIWVGQEVAYDWALGLVREGHFEWVNRYAFDGRFGLPSGASLQATSLKDLIANKVPMVPVSKPDLKLYLKADLNFLGENI